MIRSAVIWNQASRTCIKCRHPAQADVEALVLNQIANVADRIRTYKKYVVVIYFIEHEFVAVFLDHFEATEYRVFAKRVIALEKI